MLKIEHNEYLDTFKGYIGEEKVCELNLYEESSDDERRNEDSVFWLNGIYTSEGHQSKGYARKLIEEAIQIYGKILISKATEYEHKQNNDDTARHLTDDGAALVTRLVSHGVIEREWLVNPFGSYYDENDL